MARRLTKLTINEVSSVDVGAGEGVNVVLMKRATPSDKPGESTMTDDEIKALVAKSASEAAAAAVAPVQKALDATKHELAIAKMSPAHKAYFDGCADEATKKAFADMDEKGRDDHMAKNPMAKRADPVTNDQLETVTKRLTDAEAKNALLQKRLDEADLKEAQATFKKRAADIGLTNDGDGELMRKAYSGDADAQQAFEKRQAEVRKAAEAQLSTSKLFSEFGHGQIALGKAYDVLMGKAADLRKSQPTLTKEQAFAKVYEDPDNADTVAAYKRETSPGNAAAA